MSQEDKDRVREATDLVALVGETVLLQPRGGEFWGCCPFHHEKSPSFHVIPSQQRWKCFGCGKGGDCFQFVMERDNVDFPDALRTLADRAGIELAQDVSYARRRGSGSRRARLFEALEAAQRFYNAQLTRVRGSGPDRARAYLGGRGMGLEVAQRWGLGYAPGSGSLTSELLRQGFTRQELLDAKLATDKGGKLRDFFFDRVVIPIRDESGRTCAFGGRILAGDGPKYVNSPESAVYNKSKTVFALDRAKGSVTASGEVVVVEGYFDAISMHEAGIKNVVAPCGTALTPQQVKAFSRFLSPAGDRMARGRVVFFQDADEAGLKASERAFQYTTFTTASLYRSVLPEGKDPDEYLREHTADELRGVLAAAEPLARFVIDRHLEACDVTTPEGRALALSDVAQAMGPIKGTSLADDYASYVAGRLGVDPQTVKAALAQVRWAPQRVDADDEGPTRPAQLVVDARAEAPRRTAPVLLPDDARTVRVEREVLSTMAACVDEARPFAERVAQLTWADPRDEAMAWALLATPEGTTPLQALSAAEAVVPEAAQILADGDAALSGEPDSTRALEILLDDLEMRSVRRRIDEGRGRLKVTDAGADPEAFNELFSELTALQRRLKDLEERMRAVK